MPAGNTRGFSERVAVVVGGGQGVGRAVALQLALEGAFVILSYSPLDAEGASVADELRALGTLAHAVETDVRKSADVRKLFAVVDSMFGRLDLLVNSTNMRRHFTIKDFSEEAWDDVIDSTLRGAFLCVQAAVPLMRQRPSPAIVNIASEAGSSGRIGGAAYVAAHAGMIGLTKALAHELAPRVRVNCVIVGEQIDAEKAADGKNVEGAVSAKAALDLRSNIAPDEAARSCIYLLSSDAKVITGQTLVVGGAT